MASEPNAPPPPYQEVDGQKGYGAAQPPAGAYQGGGYQQPPAGAYQGGGYQQPPAGAYPQHQHAGPHQGGGYDQPKYGGGYTNQAGPGYTNQGGPQQTSYQQYGVVVQQPAPQVVLVGGCPACRVGVLEEDYTCLGVLCAILFFPLGILCCLAMRQRRCPNCGAVFD